MPPSTLQVGITGGIGSGKTFVCKIFEVLGIDVYYADERARWLQAHDAGLVQQIRATFGNQVYDHQGRLNRTFLADKVFSDTKQLSLLNGLVHPRVAEDYRQWVIQRLDHPYTLKEAALLFETGSYRQLDKIINVNASTATRVQRVLQRDTQRSRQQLMHIIDRQLGDIERSRRAHYTINNDEEKLLMPQILLIHNRLVDYLA